MRNEARLKMLLQSVTVRHKCSSARSLHRVGHRRLVRAARCRRIFFGVNSARPSVSGIRTPKALRKEAYPNTGFFSIRLILLTLTTQLKSSISHSSKSAHVHTSVKRTKLLAIWNLLLVQLCRPEFPPFCLLSQGTVTLWAVSSRVISSIWLRQ